MRPLLISLLAGLALGACESADSDGDGGESTGGDPCADAPGAEGCPCSADECDQGLECMDVDGVMQCGCASADGAGCPCGGDEDCGDLACVEGFCTASCGPDVDFMTDIENCGECGRACPDADGSCQAGECYGAPAYDECFVPGGDVSCEDQCQLLGAAYACSDACAEGAWVGFDVPGCSEAPAQMGTCADLIANPFASVHCCCAEKLD